MPTNTKVEVQEEELENQKWECELCRKLVLKNDLMTIDDVEVCKNCYYKQEAKGELLETEI